MAGPALSAPASAARPGPRYLHAGNQNVPVIASGTHYTQATLSGEVSSIVAQYLTKAHPGAIRSQVATGGSSETFGIPVSTLAGCVTRIAAGQRVLLVDVAHYGGRPAMVIVTRAPGGPEQVWVVGTGCSSASSDLLTHVTLAPAG